MADRGVRKIDNGESIAARSLSPIYRRVGQYMISNWDILLIQAARRGNLAKVQDLLARGVNVNTIDPNDTTPLLYATQAGHGDIVRVLLEYSADVNSSRKSGGLTALMLAASCDRLEILQQLLAAGADVDRVNQDGTPALMIAAYKGHQQIVAALLEAGATLDRQDQDGDTALNLAIAKGHNPIVSLLLDHYSGNAFEAGEIEAAIEAKNTAALALLIAHGLDVNRRSADGETPLIVAVEKGYLPTVEKLLQAGADPELATAEGETPLTIAAAEGYADIVHLLLASGAQPNHQNESGETALHLAAIEGRLEIVRQLLQQGAEVDKANQFGDTPLIIAIVQGYGAIVSELLQQGANPNCTNQGETPLTLAIEAGFEDICRDLLAHGANPNIFYRDGKTLLMKTCEIDNPRLARYLLEAGAEVNARDKGGATALMWASHRGALETLKVLLECPNIGLNDKNQGGLSALMLARLDRRDAIVQLLENAGAIE
jgi:uncharacterized protein